MERFPREFNYFKCWLHSDSEQNLNIAKFSPKGNGVPAQEVVSLAGCPWAVEAGSPTLPSSGAAHHGNPGCQGAMSLAVRTPRTSKLPTPCDSTMGVAKEPGGWAGRKLGRFGSIRTSLKSKKFLISMNEQSPIKEGFTGIFLTNSINYLGSRPGLYTKMHQFN